MPEDDRNDESNSSSMLDEQPLVKGSIRIIVLQGLSLFRIQKLAFEVKVRLLQSRQDQLCIDVAWLRSPIWTASDLE